MSNRWFDQGVEALQRVVKGLPAGYLCPLCFHLFTRDRIDELSVDHVPAEQLGGNRLVLTCKRCNNESGSSLQGEMRKAENPVAALRGELDRPHPLRVTLSTGAAVNAELSGGPDSGYKIEVVETTNSKANRDAFQQHLEDIHRRGITDWSLNMNFDRDRHDAIAAHVGWLREAYLAAFAILGYRYILDPALGQVREQRANPREALIPVFTIQSPENSPNDRGFFMIDDPEWLRSVAIRFGRRTIFLPRIGDPGIYQRLEERRKANEDNRLEVVGADGASLPDWPREPLFLMDFELKRPVYVHHGSRQPPADLA